VGTERPKPGGPLKKSRVHQGEKNRKGICQIGGGVRTRPKPLTQKRGGQLMGNQRHHRVKKDLVFIRGDVFGE